MFPMPKTTEMLQELDSLGFGDTHIHGDYMTIIAITHEKTTGNYVRAISSTIETALHELIVLVKIYNSFSEETRGFISRQQQAEKRILGQK